MKNFISTPVMLAIDMTRKVAKHAFGDWAELCGCNITTDRLIGDSPNRSVEIVFTLCPEYWLHKQFGQKDDPRIHATVLLIYWDLGYWAPSHVILRGARYPKI